MRNFIIKESPRGFSEVSIESELLSKRSIFFTNEVNHETCKDFIQQIIYFNSVSDQEIVV